MTAIEVAVQHHTGMNEIRFEPPMADTDSWPVAPRKSWLLLIGQNIGSFAAGTIAGKIVVVLTGSISFALPIGVIATFFSLWMLHEIERHGNSLAANYCSAHQIPLPSTPE